MANLLYHWNFTSDSSISDASGNIFTDSESGLLAQVVDRDSINSTISRDEDGINLNNIDDVSGGFIIDLYGLDTVNLGGNITIEMVVKNTNRNKDGIYFQSIREFIDENGDDLDDNLGIVTSGFNSHSAYLKLFYQDSIQNHKMQVRTDSQKNATAIDGRVTYFVKNATDVSGSYLDTSGSFNHYLVTIEHGASDTKSIQFFTNGSEAGFTTANLQKNLSNAVRQFNAIGSQKNPVNAPYLTGTVKYLKIYQGAMSDSEVTTTYNNYISKPYYSDISSATDEEKFTRRHETVNTYFTDNPNETSVSIPGNQLGLSNSTATYKVHKFTNEEEIDISESGSFHYIALEGLNNFIIFKNGVNWYKLTQTSVLSNATNARYKYEISTNSGTSYDDPVTNQTFGQSFTHSGITIAFGGAEASGASNSAICFLAGTPVLTDQGEIKIENITTKNTIRGKPVKRLISSWNNDKDIVLIKKKAISRKNNIPSRDTFISKNHGIFIKDKLVAAGRLINKKTIKRVHIGRHQIFNILLDEHSYMLVNNLKTETLHPRNRYLKKLKTI